MLTITDTVLGGSSDTVITEVPGEGTFSRFRDQSGNTMSEGPLSSITTITAVHNTVVTVRSNNTAYGTVSPESLTAEYGSPYSVESCVLFVGTATSTATA